VKGLEVVWLFVAKAMEQAALWKASLVKREGDFRGEGGALQ
jgi:hypothetical protein